MSWTLWLQLMTLMLWAALCISVVLKNR